MPLPIEATPLIAILRGVRPDEVLGIANVLIENGIRGIEVPLNSPQPLQSIDRLSATYADTCLCGAGTVLEPSQVDDVKAAGGSLIVSPNVDVRVISRALDLGLTVLPGFATATEAFTAIGAGARQLKLFPAATYGTDHLKALRAVLPASTRVYAVGGIGVGNIGEWIRAGIDGFGIGSDLFRPGRSANEVSQLARAVIEAYAGDANPGRKTGTSCASP